MLPLYQDPHFTFRFAEDRLIPRFHLEGMEAGRRVVLYALDSGSGLRGDRLTVVSVGQDGWVELPEPMIMRAGEGFVAVPEVVT